jgi:hypothetical protein
VTLSVSFGVRRGRLARAKFILALVGVRPSTSMDSEPTDKDLLSQLTTDPAAFETFYWRHLDRVIGFTARRVREPADVADVVAATFL